MGGSGSGRWSRWQDRRTTLNQIMRLDVRTLHREGYVRPWQQGILRWVEAGQCTAMVAYWGTVDRLVLRYDPRASGGEWQPVTSTFPLDWTACH